MRNLLENAAQRAIGYLEGLDARGVAPSAEAVTALKEFDRPLPAGPQSPEDTLRELDALGSPATMAMAGPRFFGFVIGGAALPRSCACLAR